MLDCRQNLEVYYYYFFYYKYITGLNIIKYTIVGQGTRKY